MSTPSSCCNTSKTTGILTGALLIAGVAAVAWLLLSHRLELQIDPLAEADRRISELEESLQRLQHSVNHTGGIR